MDYFPRMLADFATDLASRKDDQREEESASEDNGTKHQGSKDSKILESPPMTTSIPVESEGHEEEQFLTLTTEETNDPKIRQESLPPLSEGEARIVVIEDENGQRVPAMVLTSQMIKEWNLILKSRRKATECSTKMFRVTNKIYALEEKKLEIKQKKIQLREEHNELTDEEFEDLEIIQELRASYEGLAAPATEFLEQLNGYQSKLELLEEAPKAIRDRMEKYWGFVMAENNLVDFDDESDDELSKMQEDYDPFPVDVREPTPSETAREEVYSQLRETRGRIAELEEIVDNWQQHYDEQLVEYQAAVEDGTCENSRTIFDLCLLEESQDKIGALVRAEKEYDRKLEEARHLGIAINDGNTESDVISDRDDDGYTLSFEGEMSNSVDKGWIIAWVEEIENQNPDQGPECDDLNEWEVKSLAQNERDSVVYDMMARGKMRKKIDKWRKMCEAVKRPGVLSIPDRTISASTQSVVSPDPPSTASSPFITTPISPAHGLWQQRFICTDFSPVSSQNPLSPDFSSEKSSPFIMSPMSPSFRSYEIRDRGEAELSSEEALSPFSIPIQPQQQEQPQEDYGPFSPVDIQEDLY